MTASRECQRQDAAPGFVPDRHRLSPNAVALRSPRPMLYSVVPRVGIARHLDHELGRRHAGQIRPSTACSAQTWSADALQEWRRVSACTRFVPFELGAQIHARAEATQQPVQTRQIAHHEREFRHRSEIRQVPE